MAGTTTVTLTPTTLTPPPAPLADRAPRVTAADAFDRLVDFLGADPSEGALRQARRAVFDAYRQLAPAHPWSYLTTPGRLTLVAPYAAGTVAFDLTGGAHERLLTLTGGVWPEWAGKGRVGVGSVTAEVETRVSDTLLTLRADAAFPADLAAGTAYALFQDFYTLPRDFSSTQGVLPEALWCDLEYLPPRRWAELARRSPSSGPPRAYTLLGDREQPGRLALALWPSPDAAATLDFVYLRRPRPLKVLDYATGTASVTAGGSAVTFSGATLTEDMAGSVLRLSATAADAPTAAEGANPAAFEGTVLAVPSPSTCTVDAQAAATLAGAAFRVSDPVDVHDDMLTAFFRLAELHLATSRSMQKDIPVLKAAWAEALTRAREADARVSQPRHAGPR